jgi:hypothetical protein
MNLEFGEVGTHKKQVKLSGFQTTALNKVELSIKNYVKEGIEHEKINVINMDK